LNDRGDDQRVFSGLLPAELREGGEPVFAEPWQAQAFAITIHLFDRGLFTWQEWADALSREIAGAREAGGDDGGRRYYELWLTALERLVTEKTAVSGENLTSLREAWAEAYRQTPHGKPVVL
jgi:nitrile hydratase accessory protein